MDLANSFKAVVYLGPKPLFTVYYHKKTVGITKKSGPALVELL